MDRASLIEQLNQEFRKDDDLIPFVEESKYISATGTLDCSVLEMDIKDLQNLRMYVSELEANLERAGAKDYTKLQSSYYASIAGKCVDYVIEQKIKAKQKR